MASLNTSPYALVRASGSFMGPAQDAATAASAAALQDHEQALQHLSERGFIQFHPVLAERLGHKAALFLGLALYWTRHSLEHQRHRDGWFYMTARQWTQSTGLSSREQSTARELLVEHGVMQTSLRGRPPVTHYRVDLARLVKWLDCDTPASLPVADAVKLLLRNSVCFYKPLADLTGNVACGLYLSYLLQMQRKALLGATSRIGALHITQAEVSVALCLGPKVQRNARERLRQAGLLRETSPSLVSLNLPAIMACLKGQDTPVLPRSRAALQLPVRQPVRLAQPTLSPQPTSVANAAATPTKPLAAAQAVTALPRLSQQLPLGLMAVAAAPRLPRVEQTTAAVAESSALSVTLNVMRRLLGTGAQWDAELKPADPGVAENAKFDRSEVAENAKFRLPKTHTHISIGITNTTTTRARKASVEVLPDPAPSRRRISPLPSRPTESAVVLDQLPEKTVDLEAGELIYPLQLDPALLPGLRRVLSKAAAVQRQPLLDELEGQLRIQGKTIHNPAGWLMGLIRQQRQDGAQVVLALADKVAAERIQRQRVQLQVEQALQGGLPPPSRSIETKSSNPAIAETARKRLTELRAEMAKKGAR